MFAQEKKLEITPAEVEKLLAAFAQGLGLSEFSESSQECQAELDEVFQVFAVSIQ